MSIKKSKEICSDSSIHTGFLRIGTAAPKTKTGAVFSNLEEILSIIQQAKENNVGLLLFPEFTITGHKCKKLFVENQLLKSSREAFSKIKEVLSQTSMTVIFPCLEEERGLLAEKFHICRGKSVIEYEGLRYMNHNSYSFSEIIEKNDFPYIYSFEDDDITLSLSKERGDISIQFSCEDKGVMNFRRLKISAAARSMEDNCIAINISPSGDCVIAAGGKLIAENKPFSTTNLLTADVDIGSYASGNKMTKNNLYAGTNTQTIALRPLKFLECDEIAAHIARLPFVADFNNHFSDIFEIQAHGLANRLRLTNSKKAVIGVSGGLDSTLALLVCIRAMEILDKPASNVLAVTMPGFGTTDKTYENSVALIKALGARFKEISIVPAVKQHFADIGQKDDNHDITYENSQARERTQILMDLANMTEGIVVGTGDLSEIALGWSTFNGDHISMYNPNGNLPKTLIKALVHRLAASYIAENDGYFSKSENTAQTLLSVLETPISPELLPPDEEGEIKQITEDKLGPYELHDFFLYYHLNFKVDSLRLLMLAEKAFEEVYDRDTILHWLKIFYRRFFSQQFKRNAATDSPQVLAVSLHPLDSPLESEISPQVWLKPLEDL